MFQQTRQGGLCWTNRRHLWAPSLKIWCWRLSPDDSEDQLCSWSRTTLRTSWTAIGSSFWTTDRSWSSTRHPDSYPTDHPLSTTWPKNLEWRPNVIVTLNALPYRIGFPRPFLIKQRPDAFSMLARFLTRKYPNLRTEARDLGVLLGFELPNGTRFQIKIISFKIRYRGNIKQT